MESVISPAVCPIHVILRINKSVITAKITEFGFYHKSVTLYPQQPLCFTHIKINGTWRALALGGRDMPS